MPRISRAIAVGNPHHITQRGNYRQTVFAEGEDYAQYLEWLNQYARQYGLEIWAYCLMPNHVHIVGVPGTDSALANIFRTVHMQYAQYFNRKRNAAGHLWQGRYFSCVLDEPHVHAAVRYVEMNPVRAGIAVSPEDYLWSSAKSHVTGLADPVLSGRCFLVETIRDWKQYLSEAPNLAAQTNLIKSTNTGRPCGKEDFVMRMEAFLNRRLTALPTGRPRGRKNSEEATDLSTKK